MSLGGPTTTTQYNQQQNQQQQQAGLQAGQNTITPNLPGWLSNYYQQFPQQQQGLLAQAGSLANKPLYGPQQQANYQQELQRQFGQANQNLQSSLARSGALNSNRAGEAQTGLQLGQAQQFGNYLSQVPLLNAQFQQQGLGQLGNIITNAMNWKPPVIGQTSNQFGATSGSSSGTSDTSGTQTQQQSGGLLQSLLGGLLNAGMGIATGGLSNLAQGLSWGGNAVSDSVNPGAAQPGYNPISAPPTIYPWQTGAAGAPPPSTGFGSGIIPYMPGQYASGPSF